MKSSTHYYQRGIEIENEIIEIKKESSEGLLALHVKTKLYLMAQENSATKIG